MQFVFRFIDPKIPALSFEVGSIQNGQFVPVENLKSFIECHCTSLKRILRFDPLFGPQCFLHASQIGDALSDLYDYFLIDKFEFFPTFIVITINSLDDDKESEKKDNPQQ